MTTTITLETHSWPAKVTINDRFESECGKHKHHGETIEIVDPFTKKTFAITNTRSIAFDEMPLPPAEAG